MTKVKILALSDSPKLHTGFACVARNVLTHLQRTGKYEIKQIGWFHQESNEEVIYPIIQTEKDESGKITQEDKYAHKSFTRVVEEYKPDIVWTLGDHWMTDHVAKCKLRNTFKWIMYCPIDGHPSPSKWKDAWESADYLVAYGKYGMEVMRHRAPKANLSFVYHGVDTDTFRPISEVEKSEVRKTVIGVAGDKKLIGIIARNQPRKAFDKLFEAYYYVLSGDYVRCNKCHKITVGTYDLLTKKATKPATCKHCSSTDVKNGASRDDVRLYVHGAIQDCGWDLIDLQNDYNLKGKVLVNPSLRIGAGVADSTLNGIYNAIDIFTLPTRGEGFGLPILESMAAGTPVVVTDYSAHPEWCKDAGLLVPPAVLEAEPLTNIRRAIVDTDLYVTALIDLLDCKELRTKLGENGIEIAKKMDWKVICKQWEDMIDPIAYPQGITVADLNSAKLKYNLEEF